MGIKTFIKWKLPLLCLTGRKSLLCRLLDWVTHQCAKGFTEFCTCYSTCQKYTLFPWVTSVCAGPRQQAADRCYCIILLLPLASWLPLTPGYLLSSPKSSTHPIFSISTKPKLPPKAYLTSQLFLLNPCIPRTQKHTVTLCCRAWLPAVPWISVLAFHLPPASPRKDLCFLLPPSLLQCWAIAADLGVTKKHLLTNWFLKGSSSLF